MSVIAKWNLTEEYWSEYFNQFNKISQKKQFNRMFISIIVGIFAYPIIKWLLPVHYKFQLPMFINGLVFAILLFIANGYLRRYFSRKKFVKSYQDSLPAEAIFSDDDFAYNTLNSSSKFKWEAVVDLISSKDGLIVCLRGGGEIYVPEREIEGEDGKRKILNMYEMAKNRSANESTAR